MIAKKLKKSKNRRIKHACILLSVLIIVLVFAPGFVAGQLPDQAATAPPSSETSQPAEIAPEVASESGDTTLVLRLDEVSADDVTPKLLYAHAQETQQPVIDQLERAGPISVEHQFWLTNAIVIEIDLDQIPVERIASIDRVTEIHTNTEAEIEESAATSSPAANVGTLATEAESSLDDATWNVDRINAPEAWAAHETKGDGVKVAVLDTGVEADHDDIDLYTTDPDDPTYPGGWAVIDSVGNVVDDPAPPHDNHGHGTRISGLVAAGDASGEYVGVAPNADLMHAQIADDGSTSFTQIAGGLEWAVANGADVASISFGAEGYYSQLIDPIRNAESSGTLVVASIGNGGEGTSTTPGNEYDSIGVGSTDYWDDVSSFSGGEVIDTDDAWGSGAPDDWPDEYIVPQVVVPGEQVITTQPDNDYGPSSGTSASAPQVAGAIAVVNAATSGDYTPGEIQTALTETASHPDGATAQDTRYGHGILDVSAAIDFLDTGESAEFDVSSAELVDETILEGETAEVTAEVANVGDAEGEFTAVFDLTDDSGETETVDTETVSLEPGETTTVTLSGVVEEAGAYSADVSGTDAGTLTVERPAVFELDDGSLNETVITTGETVTVSAAVDNVGDREGTFEAELLVDGDRAETTDVALGAGESDTVTFEYEPAEEGEYALVVAGDDNTGDRTETDAGTVTVTTPADLEVTDATLAEDAILEGDSVEVFATVENHGGSADTIALSLEVDGTVVDSTDVAVNGGESVTVTFEERFDETGSYEITVNGVEAGQLTVEKPALFEISEASLSEETVLENESVDVSATIENAGDQPGILTTRLRVDGTTEETRAVELDGGESETVSFTYDPPSDGEYDIAVVGEDSDGETIEREAGTLLVERPANLTVTAATVEDTEILAGESTAVTATVTNDGDRDGVEEVALLVDSEVVTTTAVEVEANSHTAVTFSQSFDDAGTYSLSVDEVDAGDLTVLAPAAFDVTDATLSNTTVDEGEPVEVSATVTNTGDVSGTFTAGLEVDGESVETQTLDIAGADEVNVTFSAAFNESGAYSLAVNGTVAGTLTVEGESESYVDVTGDGNPATDTTGDGLLNDVTGDGTFTWDDVETLAYNLDNEDVQDNAELFDFAGMDETEVTAHDVQALYMQLWS